MTTSTLSIHASTGSGRVLGLGVLARCLAAVVQAFKSRRDMQVLASFDDRMLADIGLTRGDLRDAVAQPLWRDPTAVLVTRVRERRSTRLPAAAADYLRRLDTSPTGPRTGGRAAG